jgi:fermentation-respiration switch protein FrsA (DUF1100 family)
MLTSFLVAAILFLVVDYCIYLYAFGRSKPGATYSEPPGKQFKQYSTQIQERSKTMKEFPAETVSIQSYDGLKLVGSYYHFRDGAPLAIFFHGYRSTGIRDFCGGFYFYRDEGFNILLVDQRSTGRSEGKSITFGIKERWDCLAWTKYAAERWPDTPIVLLGISMGASTVLMASELPLPKQVRGILGDCAFSAPKDILCTVAASQGLPKRLSYFLLKLSARLFGGFHLEEITAADALRRTKLPVILIHGEDDEYVPCEMSLKCFEACGGPVRLLTVPKAEHGMSFFIDEEGYTKAVSQFCKDVLHGNSMSAKERLPDYTQRK